MEQPEIDALSDPSIMDEHIKQTDPEQYQRIQEANNLKWAQEAGSNLGGAMGTIQKVARPLSPMAQAIKDAAAKSEQKIIPSEFDVQNAMFKEKYKDAPSFFESHGPLAERPKTDNERLTRLQELLKARK